MTRTRRCASPRSRSPGISAIPSVSTACWPAVATRLKRCAARPSSNCLSSTTRVRRICCCRLLDDDIGARFARPRRGRSAASSTHPEATRCFARSSDPDSWVRYVTLKSLAAIAARSALPAVVARLQQDPAPHVRLAAIEVVGRLTPPEALEILEPLARGPNEDIARAAIGALGHVGQPDALAVLEQEVRAPSPWRRLAAIDALAVRGETRIAEILQWAAAADGDSDVVGAAVHALARVGVREDGQGTEATRALVSLTAEPSRRQAAIAALSSLPPRRIADIAAGLRHASPAVRCAIVEALSRMKQPGRLTGRRRSIGRCGGAGAVDRGGGIEASRHPDVAAQADGPGEDGSGRRGSPCRDDGDRAGGRPQRVQRAESAVGRTITCSIAPIPWASLAASRRSFAI